MARGRVEGCRSIDVLHWNRLGYLRFPRCFSWTWTSDGEEVGSINVETQRHSMTLKYKSRPSGEDWSNVEQRVPIEWTPCSFGGERPWFTCSVHANGIYCGRRVTKLYIDGRLFACRKCYGLAYESQLEPLRHRGLGKAQKLRKRMGGSPNMLEDFPDKPKGMRWRTYDRLRAAYDVAEARSLLGLTRSLDRTQRKWPRRARR